MIRAKREDAEVREMIQEKRALAGRWDALAQQSQRYDHHSTEKHKSKATGKIEVLYKTKWRGATHSEHTL